MCMPLDHQVLGKSLDVKARPHRKCGSGLRWWTPFVFLPHGGSGLGLVIVGAWLLGATIFGNSLKSYEGPLPYLYTFLVWINAVAGYRLARKAPKDSQSMFRTCAVFQLCLAYYVVRFLPSFSSNHVPLRVLDTAMILPLLRITLGFLEMAWALRRNPAIAISIVCGAFGIAVTLAYPMQLALQPKWLDCLVEQRYPAQNIAMAAYVYLPTTYAFAIMLFGATLHLRKLVSGTQLGLASIGLIFGTLLLMVLLQDLHLPEVSTQELYIVCPLPSSTESWEWKLELLTSPRPILVRLLQSRLVQFLLGDILGAHRIEQYSINTT